jgi:hypothetical protein
LKPVPANRLRGAYPHLLCDFVAQFHLQLLQYRIILEVNALTARNVHVCKEGGVVKSILKELYIDRDPRYVKKVNLGSHLSLISLPYFLSLQLGVG